MMRQHVAPTLLRGGALRRAFVIFAVAWAAIGTAAAHAGGPVTVMTQNLYQGTEFAHIRALVGQTGLGYPEVLAATTADYATYQQTHFKERAKQIAAEIAQNRPVLVGLQEVATWHKGPFNPLEPFALPAAASEDFTEVLETALEEDGIHYHAVSSTTRPGGNFTLAFPVVVNGNPFPYNLEAAGMVERGVILARTDLPAGQLQVSNPQSGTYSCAHCVVPLENPVTKEVIPFTDSWESVDATYSGRAFRFITTHLDALEPSGFVRYQQAKELLEGPVRTALPVILTGDMNAGPNTPPAGTGPAAYSTFLAGGLSDTWTAAGLGAPPLTCCHLGDEDLVNNPADAFQPGQELDHVFTHGTLPVLSEHLVGNTVPNPKPEPFIWPSDHAGVVATFGPKVISGNSNGPLVVKNGEWVELSSSGKISGPVTVEAGGAFDVEGGTVSGPVTAKAAAQVRMCGANVSGPVEVTGATGSVVIGDGTAGQQGGCGVNFIHGSVTVKNNTAGVSIRANTISGPATVTGNAGGTTVKSNMVMGSLTVLANSGAVIDQPNYVTGPEQLQ